MGFYGDRRVLRNFETTDLALGYAQIIQRAIRGAMDDLESSNWKDATATREALDSFLEVADVGPEGDD